MGDVAGGKVVNVNTASLESLRDDVVGIGPVLAGRIVSYREEHGPFASLSGLTSVRGIGPRLLQRIAAQLVVGENLVPLAEAPALGDAPEGGEVGVEDVAQPSVQLSQPQPIPARSVVEEEIVEAEGRAPTEESPQAGVPASEADSGEPQAASGLPQGEQLVAQIPLREDTTESVATEHIAAFAPGGPEGAESEVKQGTLLRSEQSSPPAAMAAPSGAPPQPSRSRSSVWREVVLVLLGGLLGALLALAVLLICSGTLDLAPHKEVSALSRNLGAMRSDQETAWQRINEIAQRVVGLEREVEQLGALRQRVADLEKESEAVRGDINRLAADFASLRSEVREGLESLDRRMAEMESALQRVQERVERFDAFLAGLRDLLNGMEELAPMPEGSR